MSDKRFDRLETKIDDQNEHLATIDKTLEAQHVTLKEHIRRTEALEAKVTPLEKSMWMVKGAIALLGIMATVFAILGYFK